MPDFDPSLVRDARSPAYRRFHEIVYADPTFRFNRMDLEEQDRIVALSNLSAGRRFVDLGCGTGGITRWIAEQTGAVGVGYDLAAGAVELAREAGDDVQFEVVDLDELPVPDVLFEVAFAIDTLPFVKDLGATLAGIKGLLTPEGRLVVPWSEVLEARSPGGIEPEDTALGAALDASGWDWVALESSSEDLWKRTVAAYEVLLPVFLEEEGVRDVVERRLQQARDRVQAWAEGRAQRFVFVARPG